MLWMGSGALALKCAGCPEGDMGRQSQDREGVILQSKVGALMDVGTRRQE